ncbi:MAG: DUF4157 domain-containing protein [Myxococcales bacterium]|nr:DUF4157 domain-containing protein [Myxococcales bacterium]
MRGRIASAWPYNGPVANSRELLSGSARERRVDDDDDLAIAASERHAPGKGGRTEANVEQPSGWSASDAVVPHVARYAEAAPGGGDGLAAALGIVESAAAGTHLPPELAARLGRELGLELGAVVIHDDAQADLACAEINARAFTLGNHIYFARGAYDPHSDSGVELIAHEVAHVAQQLRGTAPTRPGVSEPGDTHERDADAFARQFRAQHGARYVAKAGDDPARIVDFARAQGRRVGLPFQAELEDKLGTSFDFVETYTGDAARLACEAMSASAMVVHNIIMLADPSPQRETLLHELTHVMQMGGGRAPTAFAPGSLRVSSRDDAAEVEARGGDGPSVRADPNTIHRADPVTPTAADDASNRQKRIKHFVDNAETVDHPKAFPGFKGKHYAFRGKVTKSHYKKTSPEPWKREHYHAKVTAPSSGLPAVKVETTSDDIKEMTSTANKASNQIASVSENTYAFIKSGTWQTDVEDVRPIARPKADPDEQFECYFDVVKALPNRVTNFKWASWADEMTAEDAVIDGKDADAYRGALRTALVDAYAALPGGGWEEYYNEVMKGKGASGGKLIPAKYNGFQGSIFEDLVKKAGKTLSNTKPLFRDPSLGAAGERQGDNASGNVIIDGKAAEAGADQAQAQDYEKIITKPIPGWVSAAATGASDPKKTYSAVLYTTPGKEIGNKVAAQLDRWIKAANRSKFGVTPDPDGIKTFCAQFNPQLQFKTKEKGKSSYAFTDPTTGVAGVKVKKATFKTNGDDTAITGGTIEMDVDMAGAVKGTGIKKDIPPSTGAGLNATIENKLTGFKSTLDKALGAVDVDAKLIDGGAEATIKVKAGAAKIPNFEIDAATLTARYVDGTLSVEGEVGLRHKSGKISGKIKVSWDGANWNFDGEATLSEGLVPGLSAVKLGVSYAGGKTKLLCPSAKYQRKLGAVDLTGTLLNLSYDVDKGTFSGTGQLDADLGMFGKATATATLENNDIKQASFSYDSPELKYPKDKPAITGAVGGTIKYNNGKFSGDIRGAATLNIPGLQKLAKDGVGLAVDAHIGEDGSYSGTIKSTKAIELGKHLRIPSVGCTLEKDGSVTGDFEIEIVNIKNLKSAKAKGTVDKAGVHIEKAEGTVEFGNQEGKFWGSITASYSSDKGFDVSGTANYKIKDDITATGTVKYSQETNAIGVELKVTEITLIDKKISKQLFKASKQIPVVNVYGLGVYIDIGFDLGFDFGFKITMTPSAKVEDFSLDTMAYKRIAAKLAVGGDIYAQLTGTPKLGIGVFALDPSILRGGGGLKVPIVGRLDIKPKADFEIGHTPGGGVDGSAKLGLAGEFGIKGSVKPYAEFSVLNDAWNPKWEGAALAEFEILKPKELFNFTVDLASDKKQEDPELPGQNAAKAPSAPVGDKTAKAEPKAPTERGGEASKSQPAKQGEVTESGDEGPFSLNALMGKLKSIPGFATAEKLFTYAQKIWKVVKPIWDIVSPLMDIIAKRIEEVIGLFDPGPSADGLGGWLWKLAKLLFNLSFGGITEVASAIRSLLGKAAGFAKKLINKAVQDGHIGVKRHSYYIWKPWPFDNYEFMAAAEWKINIPGVADLGRHGPDGFLLTPSGAVALVLYEALGAVGVGYTYTGKSDINKPYNDIWTGGGARG